MIETYEQALERLKARFMEYRGTAIPSDEILRCLEEEARQVLELQTLPILQPTGKKYRYQCTKCRRFLSQNFYLTDAEGYASLNCTKHGWVGKWK